MPREGPWERLLPTQQNSPASLSRRPRGLLGPPCSAGCLLAPSSSLTPASSLRAPDGAGSTHRQQTLQQSLLGGPKRRHRGGLGTTQRGATSQLAQMVKL